MSSTPRATTIDKLIRYDLVGPSAALEPRSRHAYAVGKRAVDIVGSVIGIILLSPVMLAVAALVKLTSPGPIIFRQRRLGIGGREFWCYKFRTMVVDAEARLRNDSELRTLFDTNYKLKNDPRLTSIGSFLRKASLDELPQFFNVLNGDMSLVGPRPIVTPERQKYGEFGGKLLTVKPGLGGYWQVYGRSDTTYDQRVRMDMQYIDDRSLLLDLKLLMLTALAPFKRRGAY
jgi:lipopolysaccharide/colanic/teichoic acid biosynthesis glycosyltransferase